MLHVLLTELEIKKYPEATFNSVLFFFASKAVNMKSSFWPQSIEAQAQ